MLHHFQNVAINFIVDRHPEKRFKVTGDRDVDQCFRRRSALVLCDRSQTYIMTVSPIHVKKPIPIGRVNRSPYFFVALARRTGDFDELCSQPGVSEFGFLLG